MKRILPIVLFVGAFCSFMIGQILWDLKASQAQVSETSNVLYEQLYKKYEKSWTKKIGLKNEEYVIVNFWASWCAPCLEEIPSMLELAKVLKPGKVALLGVNSDDFEVQKKYRSTYEKLKDKIGVHGKTFEDWQKNFPTLFDEKGTLAAEFKINTVPMTLIYKKGKILKVLKGKVDFLDPKLLD